MIDCKILYSELYSKPVNEVLNFGDEVYFLYDGKLSSKKTFFKGLIKKVLDIGVIVEVVSANGVTCNKHFIDSNLLYIQKQVRI